MSENIRIVFTDRELHMVGEFTAVCWNLTTRRKTEIINGEKVTTETTVRSGAPYIDFVDLRQEQDAGGLVIFYEDDDNPTNGGMPLRFAQKIARELQAAIAYLTYLENTGDAR